MTDSIAVFPVGWRFTDANDLPLSGGTLNFFSAGTSTPLTVYSDYNLSVSLGSVVTCDSGGYPTSDGVTKVTVYTGTAAYKIVCKLADGTTVYTQDNVRGASAIPSAATSALPTTPVVSKTTNYSVVTGDRGKLINGNPTGGTFIITLPSAITAGDNFRIGVRHVGTANGVVVRTVSSQTISHQGKASTSLTLGSYGESMWFVCDGANWHVDSYVPSMLSNGLPIFKVASRTSIPPVSPAAGARYIIDSTPTGVWASSGFAQNNVVESDGNSGWFAYTPATGWLAYVEDETLYTAYYSGDWKDQTGMAKPNTSPLGVAVYEYSASNGNAGGTATTGAWTNRVLNTTAINTITGASLASNIITLPAGTYFLNGFQGFYEPTNSQIRVVVLSGTATPTYVHSLINSTSDTFDQHTSMPNVSGVLVATTQVTLAFQYYVSAVTGGGNGLGLPSPEPAGMTEIHARLTIIDMTAPQGPKGDPGEGSSDSAVLADVVNLYTIDNTGASDVTSALATAISALDAQNRGIYFRGGDYLMGANSLTIPDGFVIHCHPRARFIRNAEPGVATPMFILGNRVEWKGGVIKSTVTSAAVVALNSCAMMATSKTDVSVHDLRIEGRFYVGLCFNTSTNCVATNFRCYGVKNRAFYVYQKCDNVSLSNFHINGYDFGTTTNYTDYGVNVNAANVATSNEITDLVITNGTIERCGDGITIGDLLRGVNVSNVTVQNSTSNGFICWLANGGAPQGVTYTGCQSRFNGADGVLFLDCFDAAWSGSISRNNTGYGLRMAGAQLSSCTGSHIMNNTLNGVYMAVGGAGNCARNSVVGSHVFSNLAYGVRCDAAQTLTVIVGNHVYNNTTANVSDATGTAVTTGNNTA